VQPDVEVKKGQPLFQFDSRPYLYKVQQLKAQLAQARQNVKALKADVEIASHKLARAQSESVFAKYQQNLTNKLLQRWCWLTEDASAAGRSTSASLKMEAELERAKINLQSIVMV
jgi:multidrug resistance efflux pump